MILLRKQYIGGVIMTLEKRDLVKCIILSIVTCGIYLIYWNVQMGKDAVHVKDANDDGTLEILLMIFFPFIGFYLAEKKFNEGCQEKGIPHDDRSIIYLVLGLLSYSFVNAIIMQSDLNKLADAGFDISGNNYYTNGYQNPPQYGNQQQYGDPQNNQYNNPPYEQQNFNQQNPNQQNYYNPYDNNNGQNNPNG